MTASSERHKHGGWLGRLLALGRAAVARPAPAEVVFAPDFLAALERLRLVALRAMGGGLREGHRLGAYKGGQLEFHGHRSYTPGDELRYVDWNSYARLGRPYVKEFAREEAGVLHLLLDATPSMALGLPSKWTFARRVAALFAHVALASQDVARVYLFRGPGRELERFPVRSASAGTRDFLAFLQGAHLASCEAQRGQTANLQTAGDWCQSPLASAVSGFLRAGPTRGRALVISDFWQEEQEIVAAVARLAGAGFDPAAIHVLAPEEIQPQVEGELLARSLEEEGEAELSAGADFPARYTQELESHCRAVEETFRRRGGNYLRVCSDTSIERVLITALRQRKWVM
ncbi:MAG: DUF58 domain-containing protein [Planctomycetota bacterium]